MKTTAALLISLLIALFLVFGMQSTANYCFKKRAVLSERDYVQSAVAHFLSLSKISIISSDKANISFRVIPNPHYGEAVVDFIVKHPNCCEIITADADGALSSTFTKVVGYEHSTVRVSYSTFEGDGQMDLTMNRCSEIIDR